MKQHKRALQSCFGFYFLFFFAHSTFAATLCELQQLYKVKHADWPTEYVRLRETLQNSSDSIGELLRPASYVQEVYESVQTDSVSAWAIVRVNTVDGPKVLKVLDAPMESKIPGSYSDARYYDQVLLQKFLGDFGLSIPVHGILDKPALTELLKNHPEILGLRSKSSGEPQWAFIMDHIPDGWNPKPPRFERHLQKPAPPHAKNWNRDAIRTRIMEIGEALIRLGITPVDLQFIFSAEGQPYVFDMEIHIVNEPNNLVPKAFKNPLPVFLLNDFHEFSHYVIDLINRAN